MEAKDMVMGDKERLNLFDEAGSKGIALSEQADILLKAQAEISFKAGRKAEKEWAACNQYRDEQLEEARKAGIREVVKWIQQDGYLVDQRATNLGDFPVFLCHSKRWQAKLKEWGLEESNDTN